MAHLLDDRIKETTTSTGTGVITLAGAVAGFKAFSAVLANNDTTYYAIVDNASNAWETGVGTLTTATTLTRTTVLESSNANALVNFAAGSKDIFITLPGTKTMPILPDNSSMFPAVSAEPATPLDGQLAVYAKSVAGRTLLKIKGPSGLDTPLQPAIFQNSLWLVQPNSTTSVSAVGGAVTNAGTISHITPSAFTFGYCTNFLSAATANATVGTSQAVAPLNTSSGVQSNGGFFTVHRLFFPDAEYTTNPIRFFVGVFAGTLAQAVTADNPAFARIGISKLSADTNFFLTTRNATTETRVDTGVAFVSNNLYDFYITYIVGNAVATWRIDNLSTGTSTEGTTTTTLPPATTYMRAGFQMCTINAAAHNIRMKKIFVETDN